MMQLQVAEMVRPEPIRWNYDELKAELTEKTEVYKSLVYTADSIKSAKEDRANLNRLKKAINDERIRIEKEYQEPFQTFKSQVAELCGIVDDAAKAIDKQVKEYEEIQKKEKYEEIKVLFEAVFSEEAWVNLDRIFDDKWLNASVSLKKIEDALNEKRAEILNCLEMLDRLKDYSFEAKEVYKETLNIESAWREADKLVRMAKAKEQAEAARAEAEKAKEQQAATADPEPVAPEPVQEEIYTFKFLVSCTRQQALNLRDFLISEGIEYARI